MLFSLAETLARVENLSHAVAWSRYENAVPLSRGAALPRMPQMAPCPCIEKVELPRLKLGFVARRTSAHYEAAADDGADASSGAGRVRPVVWRWIAQHLSMQ